MSDWCEKCEEMMQPYLDGILSAAEVVEAKEHLARCKWCEDRYRFEERLRHFVRVAATEPMPQSLHDKLAAMRLTT